MKSIDPGLFRHRKSDTTSRKFNDQRLRDIALFILKLIAVLFVIFAIFRHRIFRLK